MKADKETYIKDKLKFGDPNEMKIIMNEFNFNLNTKNYELCNYWLSWALEFEKRNTKKIKPKKIKPKKKKSKKKKVKK